MLDFGVKIYVAILTNNCFKNMLQWENENGLNSGVHRYVQVLTSSGD